MTLQDIKCPVWLMMPRLCYSKGVEVYTYICYIYIHRFFPLVYTHVHIWFCLHFGLSALNGSVFFIQWLFFFLKIPEKCKFKLVVLFLKSLVYSRGCCIYMYIYMTLNTPFLGSDMGERYTLFPLTSKMTGAIQKKQISAP